MYGEAIINNYTTNTPRSVAHQSGTLGHAFLVHFFQFGNSRYVEKESRSVFLRVDVPPKIKVTVLIAGCVFSTFGSVQRFIIRLKRASISIAR